MSDPDYADDVAARLWPLFFTKPRVVSMTQCHLAQIIREEWLAYHERMQRELDELEDDMRAVRCECRRCNRTAVELERLRVIVDKLPKTADGVPIVPGRPMMSDVTTIKAELWDLRGHVCNGRLTMTADGRRDPGDRPCRGCARAAFLKHRLRAIRANTPAADDE